MYLFQKSIVNNSILSQGHPAHIQHLCANLKLVSCRTLTWYAVSLSRLNIVMRVVSMLAFRGKGLNKIDRSVCERYVKAVTMADLDAWALQPGGLPHLLEVAALSL